MFKLFGNCQLYPRRQHRKSILFVHRNLQICFHFRLFYQVLNQLLHQSYFLLRFLMVFLKPLPESSHRFIHIYQLLILVNPLQVVQMLDTQPLHHQARHRFAQHSQQSLMHPQLYPFLRLFLHQIVPQFISQQFQLEVWLISLYEHPVNVLTLPI